MAMKEARLAEKIIQVMKEIRIEKNNPEKSMETFAYSLAKAIVEEVRRMDIIASAPNGAITVIEIE